MRVVLAMMDGLFDHAFRPEHLDRLRAVADVPDPRPVSDFGDERARRLLADCDVILAHWGCPPLDAAVLDLVPRLGMLAYAAGTVKWTVTPALFERGVVVTSAAAANAVPVAEYALAAVLLANKGAFVAREWLRDPSATLKGPDPVGNVDKQVGVIGASHVGRKLIDLLRGFDLSVVVYDPYLATDEAAVLGVAKVELDELLATSDVVSLHAPDVPATKGMIGRRELALMKDGSTFVNTARGALVDHGALEEELRSGRISAVLDVTDPEPLPRSSPLYELPNAFLTPHLAGAQGTELVRLADLAVTEIERFARGEPPLHPVRAEDLDRIA